MKFQTFAKLGGHAFSLMQNKDLAELFGMAKPYFENLKKGPVPPATSTNNSSPPPVQQWPAGTFPNAFPPPIDSPYMFGPNTPFGPVGRPPAGYYPPGYYGGPPGYTRPQNPNGWLVSGQKIAKTRNRKKK